MATLGNGGLWWQGPPRRHRPFRSSKSESSDAVDGGESALRGPGRGFNFPLKPALTAASLALTGDTIAQIRERWKRLDKANVRDKDVMMKSLVSEHDWLRAVRMASYGFLLYGPGSYAWYQYLDSSLPKPTFTNLSLKVLLNQIVLGPSVIAVVFAWNNLWQGKLEQLPAKYQNDALPTLLYGFRFWIPVSVLNFWVVPLQTRVAFMSTCSIFWNFYLSSTISK
ncbi:hypothetical protein H6P81_014319 [Aristolochia fimbriata]|uniref:Protein Mpv17 n=1 Tax=Aristolochia fimbriata TaxID=158543 RepID=A0AAV7EIB8_ARIFI|nr:hypothetical protein H6P81_014319 [Aristolochia fimbriata]